MKVSTHFVQPIEIIDSVHRKVYYVLGPDPNVIVFNTILILSFTFNGKLAIVMRKERAVPAVIRDPVRRRPAGRRHNGSMGRNYLERLTEATDGGMLAAFCRCRAEMLKCSVAFKHSTSQDRTPNLRRAGYRASAVAVRANGGTMRTTSRPPWRRPWTTASRAASAAAVRVAGHIGCAAAAKAKDDATRADKPPSLAANAPPAPRHEIGRGSGRRCPNSQGYPRRRGCAPQPRPPQQAKQPPTCAPRHLGPAPRATAIA